MALFNYNQVVKLLLNVLFNIQPEKPNVFHMTEVFADLNVLCSRALRLTGEINHTGQTVEQD